MRHIRKAMGAYQESVRQALRVSRETIEQAWKSSRETSEQIWKIFQGVRQEKKIKLTNTLFTVGLFNVNTE